MKYRTKMLFAGLTGAAISLFFLGYSIWGQDQIHTLNRPESGSGDREESLQVEMQGRKYPVKIILRELPYGEEEERELLQKAAGGLEKIFLQENPGAEQVVSDVKMPDGYPGTQISIQWYLDSWEYVKPDGRVENEFLKEPVKVKVQAVLTLETQSLNWEKEIQICPPSVLDTGQKLNMLAHEIQELQTEDLEKLELPESVLGETVRWYPAGDTRWLEIGIFTGLVLCLMVWARKNEEEKREKQRERSMQLAYPDIVSMLSLYMGAGISTRKAWERIVKRYEQEAAVKAEYQNIYREMSTTLHEMQSGVPETMAYERFGTRCRLPCYLKLGTLLSQNLRRGTKGLAGLLTEDSREAFEERKALAKKLGEECESKLLLPMMLMLLTILIMLMYPAIISFQI